MESEENKEPTLSSAISNLEEDTNSIEKLVFGDLPKLDEKDSLSSGDKITGLRNRVLRANDKLNQVIKKLEIV